MCEELFSFSPMFSFTRAFRPAILVESRQKRGVVNIFFGGKIVCKSRKTTDESVVLTNLQPTAECSRKKVPPRHVSSRSFENFDQFKMQYPTFFFETSTKFFFFFARNTRIRRLANASTLQKRKRRACFAAESLLFLFPFFVFG